MKIKYIISAFAAIAVVSCQKAEENIFTDANVVRIGATVNGHFTRSNPIGSEEESAKLNIGDEIYVGTDKQAVIRYKFDGTTWNHMSVRNLYWEAEQVKFYACYPAATSGLDFELPADQSSVDKMELADYMTYEGTQTKNATNTINLKFERKTARIIVNITSYGTEITEAQKNVTNVLICSGANRSLFGEASGPVKPTTAYTNIVNKKYTSLIIPTGAKLQEKFIILTLSDGKILSTKGIPALQAGKSYTYNLKLGQDLVTISGVTVSPWNPGTEDLEDLDVKK